MQVGDYITYSRYRNDNTHIHIGLIDDIHIDGFIKIVPKACYNSNTKQYSAAPETGASTYITKTKFNKVYHPILEELFIFKQIEENPNGTYTLQVQ